MRVYVKRMGPATHTANGRSVFARPWRVDAFAQGRSMVKLPSCWQFACRAVVIQNAFLVRVTYRSLASIPVMNFGASH